MKIRRGYPTRRNTSEPGPVVKKRAYGRHLTRYMTNARGKFLVLHSTRGWKIL